MNKTGHHLLSLSFILACLFFTNLSAADFFVVKQGKAYCSIETGKNPDPVVLLAAKELQHWIKEISGAVPQIREQAQEPKIVLAVDNSIPELKGNDGYAIRCEKNAFRIIGSCPKGVLNGVYRTLYRDGGLIWARPEQGIGTIVRKKTELKFNADPRLDVPAYILRGWQVQTLKNIEANDLWLVRNNTNRIFSSVEAEKKYGCIMEFGGGHNLCHLYIPEELYAKAHPDFYPEIEGKRVRPSMFRESCQLCYTNPELVKEIIKRLDMFVQKNPDFQVYRVLFEDNYHLCTCKKCMEPIRLPDGSLLDGRNLKPQSKEWKVWRSTQFFIWFNQFAEFMKKKYPGKRLMSYAYYFTEYAPKIKIMDNVDISFCPIYRDGKFAVAHKKNQIVLKTVDEWLKMTPNVTWREYYGLSGEYPRPIDRLAYEDYQLLHKRGLRKTYSEMTADSPEHSWDPGMADRFKTNVWDLNAPYFWSLAQAPWNPNRKVEDVRREFYERVFGKAAAPHVEAFYNEIEKAWYKNPRMSTCYDKAVELWNDCYFSVKIDKICEKHLADALKKVDTPNGKALLLRLQKQVLCRNVEPVAEKLVIPKAKDKVVFDPEFKNPVWKDAIVLKEFFDDKGNPCPYPTEILLLHDGKKLYAAMKATRPGLQKLLDPKQTYLQVEAFEIGVQLTDGAKPDYFQMAVDPVNHVYATAANKRSLPYFPWTHQAWNKGDQWSAFITIPLNQIAKGRKLACFRRYKNIYVTTVKPGYWPTHGAGQKNAVRGRVNTFSPFELGK